MELQRVHAAQKSQNAEVKHFAQHLIPPHADDPRRRVMQR
jgi:hypothetical protein